MASSHKKRRKHDHKEARRERHQKKRHQNVRLPEVPIGEIPLPPANCPHLLWRMALNDGDEGVHPLLAILRCPPPPPPPLPLPPQQPLLMSTREGVEVTIPVTQSSKSESHSEVQPIDEDAFNAQDMSEVATGRISDYTILAKAGEGSYGKVYKARRNLDRRVVALKRICSKGSRHLEVAAVREAKALHHLKHGNVVEMLDLIKVNPTEKGDSGFRLVLEYAEHDLFCLLHSSEVHVDLNQAARLFKSLLLALDYCHRRGIVHRDLKASNLLINARGELKLADFGMSRLHVAPFDLPEDEGEGPDYTNLVVTLNYRPLELLLGAKRYGAEVDLWSAGCVLGELFIFKLFFPGRSELEVISDIIKMCGSLPLSEWPEAERLPHYNIIKSFVGCSRRLRQKFERFPPDAVDLLDSLLQLVPSKRPTAAKALNNPWLEDGEKARPLKIPGNKEYHEILLKGPKAEKRRHQAGGADEFRGKKRP